MGDRAREGGAELEGVERLQRVPQVDRGLGRGKGGSSEECRTAGHLAGSGQRAGASQLRLPGSHRAPA